MFNIILLDTLSNNLVSKCRFFSVITTDHQLLFSQQIYTSVIVYITAGFLVGLVFLTTGLLPKFLTVYDVELLRPVLQTFESLVMNSELLHLYKDMSKIRVREHRPCGSVSS